MLYSTRITPDFLNKKPVHPLESLSKDEPVRKLADQFENLRVNSSRKAYIQFLELLIGKRTEFFSSSSHGGEQVFNFKPEL